MSDLASQAPLGLYNAPLHTATKLNRAHLEQQLIAEQRVQELLTLFEVQFDALRRAEALQTLYIQEIRNLKALRGATRPEEPSENQKLLRSGYPIATAKPQPKLHPAPKPKSLDIDIEL